MELRRRFQKCIWERFDELKLLFFFFVCHSNGGSRFIHFLKIFLFNFTNDLITQLSFLHPIHHAVLFCQILFAMVSPRIEIVQSNYLGFLQQNCEDFYQRIEERLGNVGGLRDAVGRSRWFVFVSLFIVLFYFIYFIILFYFYLAFCTPKKKQFCLRIFVSCPKFYVGGTA